MNHPEDKPEKYHIQPYHMNGLNWTLVPDDPQRDNIVIVTGFMPSWWHQQYNISFGKEFHLAPSVQKQTLCKMAAILNERFADIPNFFYSPFDYENAYPTERSYGDGLIPAMFDVEICFDDASGHPYTNCANLTDEQAYALTVPDVEKNQILSSILDARPDSQIPAVGELGFEGVLNIAYQLRGQEIFMDMALKPDLAKHLFDVICQTIDKTVHVVRNWQEPTGSKPSYFVTANCMTSMVSGEMYRNDLVEYDMRFKKSFSMFGVHTCNWTVDPYLDTIAQIGELAYMDMGTDTDLEKVHKLFGDLEPTVFFHPERLRNLSASEIKKEITELGKRIGRGYILLSDLETGTTDAQIRTAYEAAAAL